MSAKSCSFTVLYLAITVLMDDCASWDLSLNFPLIFLYSTLLRLKKFKSKEWVKTYSEIKLHACRYCSVIWRNSVSCSEDTLILIFNVFVNIKTVFSKPYNPYILTVIVKKFFKIYSLSWQSSSSDYKSEVSALLFFWWRWCFLYLPCSPYTVRRYDNVLFLIPMFFQNIV